MKLKQRKNFGFIATFVCLSLIFAGVSPSVLCETVQERGKFNGILSDLDSLSDLCDFKSEEKLGIYHETNTNSRIKSLRIPEERYSSLLEFLQDFRMVEELVKVLDNLQAVFAEKLALETDKNAFSLRKIPKPSVFNFGKKSLNSGNFIADKFRSIFPTPIDFHIPFRDEILVKFDLFAQDTTKVQIHRIGKVEISRILVVYCFPRASI